VAIIEAVLLAGYKYLREVAMKNSSESYLSAPQSYQHKPQEYLFDLEDDRVTSALGQGLYHQVEDWVALELTAEQMLADEFNTVTTYVAGDAKQFWDAVKDRLLPYELAAGQFLMSAADPTQVAWSQHAWWGDKESPH
jgi:hypothetical protein